MIVGKWSLNGNPNDSAGSNNGVSTNITWGDGKMNGGASFNGTNSYISLPDFDYNLPTSFGYDCLIKINNYSDYNGIIQHDKGSVTASRGTLFRTNQTTGTLNFIRLNSAGSVVTNITSSNAVGTGKYVLVSATFDNTIGSRLYINGIQVASDSVLTNTNDCTAPIGVGTLDVSVGTQNAMDGIIDEIEIHNTAPKQVHFKNKYLYYNGFI